MRRTFAAAQGVLGGALFAGGLFVMYLNTGPEGTAVGDGFLVAFSITAAVVAVCSIAALRRPASDGWLWVGTAALAVLLWGSLLAAAI